MSIETANDRVSAPSRPVLLTVPGFHGSGPTHWQTVWEAELPARRIEQRSWAQPHSVAWTQRIIEAVRSQPRSIILIAHSLGCIAVARAAPALAERVAGAFLVAPADVERADTPAALENFRPIPLTRLPFPSAIVASSTDPYLSIHRAAYLAAQWGSSLHHVGRAGHINVDSGHGPWPEGRRLLAEFLESLRESAND